MGSWAPAASTLLLVTVACNRGGDPAAATRQKPAPQETLTATYLDAARLADILYRGGVTTYLEVLDSERNVYAAELNLARARLEELTAAVQLYSALGGGGQ